VTRPEVKNTELGIPEKSFFPGRRGNRGSKAMTTYTPSVFSMR